MTDGFRGVPGVPDGWDAVRFDYVRQWEFWLDKDGDPIQHTSSFRTQCKQLIIRKIEKPKRYRPFASAEEFKPHRDRWWRLKEESKDKFHPPGYYSDDTDWERSFEVLEFDDGTPYGVEVTDDQD